MGVWLWESVKGTIDQGRGLFDCFKGWSVGRGLAREVLATFRSGMAGCLVCLVSHCSWATSFRAGMSSCLVCLVGCCSWATSFRVGMAGGLVRLVGHCSWATSVSPITDSVVWPTILSLASSCLPHFQFLNQSGKVSSLLTVRVWGGFLFWWRSDYDYGVPLRVLNVTNVWLGEACGLGRWCWRWCVMTWWGSLLVSSHPARSTHQNSYGVTH